MTRHLVVVLLCVGALWAQTAMAGVTWQLVIEQQISLSCVGEAPCTVRYHAGIDPRDGVVRSRTFASEMDCIERGALAVRGSGAIQCDGGLLIKDCPDGMNFLRYTCLPVDAKP